MEAFWELSTTRSFGQSPGPVPWNHVRTYALDLELSEDDFEVFLQVMRELDSVWLSWAADMLKPPR